MATIRKLEDSASAHENNNIEVWTLALPTDSPVNRGLRWYKYLTAGETYCPNPGDKEPRVKRCQPVSHQQTPQPWRGETIVTWQGVNTQQSLKGQSVSWATSIASQKLNRRIQKARTHNHKNLRFTYFTAKIKKKISKTPSTTSTIAIETFLRQSCLIIPDSWRDAEQFHHLIKQFF